MDAAVVSSQIRAALRMLCRAIDDCPDDLWNRPSDHNPFWVLAYHTLYFAHLYLSPSEEAFDPFDRQVAGYSGYGRTDLGDWVELTPKDVFGKVDVLAYCDHIDGRVAELVASTPFDAESGFSWLKFSKGEAHLYNLRHIQHHAGQLTERLRQEAKIGGRWIFDGR
ncbi:DinB family protein [Candidatus Bipolaricaulota bacterium]|nr:DinB family protein [Candidatus Bipolaricaulota bacterium]TFH09291.1 MAG: DinB family protein [Candidatus Atribacteria bacterium]